MKHICKYLIIFICLISISCETVKLTKNDGGLLVVDGVLNGKVIAPFIIDTGSSMTSIPDYVAHTLFLTGTLTKKDIIGKQVFTLADGTTVNHYIVRIKTIKIGTRVFKNVDVCIGTESSPVLLGNDILSRIGSVNINYRTNKIIF